METPLRSPTWPLRRHWTASLLVSLNKDIANKLGIANLPKASPQYLQHSSKRAPRTLGTTIVVLVLTL